MKITIELRRPGWMTPTRLRSARPLLLLLALVLAGPVLAADRFSDVPADSVHHDDIGAIAAAGITLGCNAEGTLYCPATVVTRDQMGSFLARAAGLGANPPVANADKLDGIDASGFAPADAEAWHEVGAPGEPAFGVCARSGPIVLALWQNVDGSEFNTAGFYRDPYGTVHLKGWVFCPESPSHFGVFELPEGYRPAKREVLAAVGESGFARVRIGADFWVALESSGRYVSLDGITFRATD